MRETEEKKIEIREEGKGERERERNGQYKGRIIEIKVGKRGN